MCGKPAVETCGAMGACNQHRKESIWWNCVRESGGTVTRLPRDYKYGKSISGGVNRDGV